MCPALGRAPSVRGEAGLNQHLHWVDHLCGCLLRGCDHLLQEIFVVVVGALNPGVGRCHTEDCKAGRERVLHLEEVGFVFVPCVGVWFLLCDANKLQRMTTAKERE